jgi:DNA-binding transcriptional LysR family regulator
MRLLRGLDVGELTVGAGTYPSEMLVASAVARLVRAHPDVRVRVVTDNWAALLGLVRRRELDLAVADATTARDDRDIHLEPLLRHQGYFVVRRGHPLLVPARIELSDVLRFPFVGVSRLPPRLLEPLLRAAPASSVPARQTARSIPSVACDSPSAIRTIVAGSDSVGLLPLSLIGVPGEVPRLEVLPLVEPWLHGEFAVIRLASRSLSPLGEEFARLVREEDAEVRAAEDRLACLLLRTASGDRGPGARPTPSSRRRGPAR